MSDAPFDATLARPRQKRMLPSVSEVVKELTALEPKAEPGLLFKVARQVCAEELHRVKQGGESVALPDLVRRARELLLPPGATPYPPPLAVPPAPIAQPSLFETAAPAFPPPARAEDDDPFNETSGALDLKWDREAREPLAAIPESSVAAADEKTFVAPVPAALSPERTMRYAEGPTVVLPSEPGVAPRRPPVSVRRESPTFLPAEVEGPGESTLAKLAVEAKKVDLRNVVPHAIDEPVPLAARPHFEEVEVARRLPDPVSPLRDTKTGPSRKFVGAVAVLAVLVGLGMWLWPKLTGEGDAARDAVKEPFPRRAQGRVAAPSVSTPPVGGPTAAPATAATASTPASVAAASKAPAPTRALARVAAPAPVPTARPAATAPAPPAIARVEKPTPALHRAEAAKPTAASTRPLRSKPETRPVDVTQAPAPVPVVSAPATPRPEAPAKRAAAVPAASSRVAPLVTKDWAGKPPIFVLHFSSYQERAKAEGDAARLGKLFRQPAHAVEVNLGAKGVWFRSVLGEFATAEEANAFRADLAAKKTPGLGFVYRMSGG